MIVMEGVCTFCVVVYPSYTSIHSYLVHVSKILHQVRRVQVKNTSLDVEVYVCMSVSRALTHSSRVHAKKLPQNVFIT